MSFYWFTYSHLFDSDNICIVQHAILVDNKSIAKNKCPSKQLHKHEIPSNSQVSASQQWLDLHCSPLSQNRLKIQKRPENMGQSNKCAIYIYISALYYRYTHFIIFLQFYIPYKEMMYDYLFRRKCPFPLAGAFATRCATPCRRTATEGKVVIGFCFCVLCFLWPYCSWSPWRELDIPGFSCEILWCSTVDGWALERLRRRPRWRLAVGHRTLRLSGPKESP